MRLAYAPERTDMTVEAVLTQTLPLRVYVDLRLPEGKDTLQCVEQYGFPYYYIPTRWAQPKVAYGARFEVGLSRIRALLEELAQR